MSNIEYHEGHLAICVKNRNLYSDICSCSSGELQEAYEQCREAFWEDLAPEISEKYGYGKVYSEGRSEGWLTVEFPPDYVGERWRSFVEEIRGEMEYCCNERLIEILSEISAEKEISK